MKIRNRGIKRPLKVRTLNKTNLVNKTVVVSNVLTDLFEPISNTDCEAKVSNCKLMNNNCGLHHSSYL